MGRFDELVPERIRTLKTYTPGKPLQQAEQESGRPCIKLASNENPWGPSPRAIAAIHETAASVHLYPDTDAMALRAALAKRNQVPIEQVLVMAGSSQLVTMVGHVLLGPGLNAVTSERSFIAYAIAVQSGGGELRRVPQRDNTFDLDGILAAVDRNTRVVWLPNPNNPTGTIVDPKALDRFLDRLPSHVLLVLDEAYHEFAQHFARLRGREYTHSFEYVRQERNVLVMRTFSKILGLAGLRVGYAFGPAELVQYFINERTPFSIASVAESAAIAGLADEDYIRHTVEKNAEGAEWLTEQMTAMGLPVTPTWANFLYFEVGEGAARIAEQMQDDDGVIVRPLGPWGAPRALRVTIGKPEENEAFVRSLQRVMARSAV